METGERTTTLRQGDGPFSATVALEEVALSPKGGMALVKFTIEVDAVTVLLLVFTVLALSATK